MRKLERLSLVSRKIRSGQLKGERRSVKRGQSVEFAAGGKAARKKDLGMIAMTYGNVYVASVAMGADPEQTLRTFLEAEAYDGPALIIAYSHCIAHGIEMSTGMQNQRAAVASGQWLLYRYNPDLEQHGENPLTLDSHGPKIPLEQYMGMENRFKMLSKGKPEEAKRLLDEAQRDVEARWQLFSYLAARPLPGQEPGQGRIASEGKLATVHEHVLLPSRPLKLQGRRRVINGL